MSTTLLTTVHGTKIEKPTFDKFLSSVELVNISKTAKVKHWDFNTCLGDTIKEKYESLYVLVLGVIKELVDGGAAGYFWLAASREVTSIFETCTAGFNPAPWTPEEKDSFLHGQSHMGIKESGFLGVINGRWRLYHDTELEKDVMVIGANDKVEPIKNYTVVKIHNFII